MRASVVIASHNEGETLLRTVRTVLETTAGLDFEVVVSDDGSSDGSIDAAKQSFPMIRVIGNDSRRGVSLAKHQGAVAAVGHTLVFLDAHCKPEPGALGRLVASSEESDCQIITPEITALDANGWQNLRAQRGNGYRLDLETLETEWIPTSGLRPRGRFYESPSLMGCCLAISRDAYGRLGGFDVGMLQWGVEDVDLALKAWLSGLAVLHDPQAVVGHRFQQSFTRYQVDDAPFLANGLRLARRSFRESTWQDWVDRARRRSPDVTWSEAWRLFEAGRASAELDRERLLAAYRFDEFWFADRFDLKWPFAISSLLDDTTSHRSRSALDLASYISRHTRYRGPLDSAQLKQHFRDSGGVTIYLRLGRGSEGQARVESARFEATAPPALGCYLALACHLASGEPLHRVRAISAESMARLLGPEIGTTACAAVAAQFLATTVARI